MKSAYRNNYLNILLCIDDQDGRDNAMSYNTY